MITLLVAQVIFPTLIPPNQVDQTPSQPGNVTITRCDGYSDGNQSFTVWAKRKSVWGQGGNSTAQVLGGSGDPVDCPVRTGLGQTVEDVAASKGGAAAVLADGSVRTWGSNTRGKAGTGTPDTTTAFYTSEQTPVFPVAVDIVDVLAMTDTYHFLDAINHDVYWVGSNERAGGGTGSTDTDQHPGVQKIDFTLPEGEYVEWFASSGTSNHYLWVTNLGRVLVGGANQHRQIIDSSDDDITVPTLIEPWGPSFTAGDAAVNFRATYVLVTNGTDEIQLWYAGDDGREGSGSCSSTSFDWFEDITSFLPLAQDEWPINVEVGSGGGPVVLTNFDNLFTTGGSNQAEGCSCSAFYKDWVPVSVDAVSILGSVDFGVAVRRDDLDYWGLGVTGSYGYCGLGIPTCDTVEQVATELSDQTVPPWN